MWLVWLSRTRVSSSVVDNVNNLKDDKKCEDNNCGRYNGPGHSYEHLKQFIRLRSKLDYIWA